MRFCFASSDRFVEYEHENSTTKNYCGVNPFHATDLFRWPLKTSENQRFSDVFRGYQKWSVVWNGLITIETTLNLKKPVLFTCNAFHIGTKYCRKRSNIYQNNLVNARQRQGLLFHKTYFCVFFCIFIFYLFNFFLCTLFRNIYIKSFIRLGVVLTVVLLHLGWSFISMFTCL